jgi:dipeptidyl aminopeptidase/acylaminoacyl peptidase
MQVQLKTLLLILATSLNCGAAIPVATETQEAKPLAVEDALRIKEFGPLMPIALSPDGTQLACTVQDNGRARALDWKAYDRTGVPPWAAGTDIWVQNIESGAIRNLTDSKGDNWLPVWSRDGHYLAFLSTRDGADQARLWVWDATQDKLRKVTDTKLQGNEIEWTPDSRHLLVTTPVGDLSRYDDVPKASSDSDADERPENAESGSTAILYLRDGVSDAAKRSSRSGPFNLDQQLRNLVSVDVRNGEISALVHETRIMAYLLSPDGSRIAYTIPARLEKPGSQQVLFDLTVIGIAGDQARILASEIPLDLYGDRFRWSPDSRRIAYCEGGPRADGDCYVAAVDGKSPQNVTRLSPETDIRSSSGSVEPLWDGQGKTIFFLRGGALWRADVKEGNANKLAEIPGREIREMIPRSGNLLWTRDDGTSTVVVTHDNSGKQDGFYKIDLRSGKSIRLLESGRCYTCIRASRKFTVTDDGRRLVYFEEDAGHSSDLWTSDAGLQSVRRLTHLNPQFDKFEMGAAQLVRWLSDDGQSLQGTLLLPSDYKAGVRYPLVVWVYGGHLQSNDFDQFGLVATGPFNMQLLATRGYAVLLPDMPIGVGTPMADIAKTVLPGVNKVIELGIADPAHLGVMGHSFGGYSTLSLIVQTTRFSAAIEASGFADIVGDYGEMKKDGTAFAISTEEQGRGSMGGSPWDVRDRYIANSPVFFFDRIQTPLLIIQGAEDPVVAPYLGDEVFVDLRRLGKDVEYAKYEGEGHSPLNWRYANQVDLCNRVIAWFDKYLK